MIKAMVPALVAIWWVALLPASADAAGTGPGASSIGPAAASQWQINRIRTGDRVDRSYDYADDDPYYDDGYDDRYPGYAYDNYDGGNYYPRGYRGRYWKWRHGDDRRTASDGIQTPAQQGGMRGR